MVLIFPHPDFTSDMRRIMNDDPEGFAALRVFLEEYLGGPDAARMLSNRAYRDKVADVSPVQSQVEVGNTGMRRLKVVRGYEIQLNSRIGKTGQLTQYRLLCGVDRIKRRITLLGVIERNKYNYEPKHPFTIRCVQAYVGTGNPRRRH